MVPERPGNFKVKNQQYSVDALLFSDHLNIIFYFNNLDESTGGIGFLKHRSYPHLMGVDLLIHWLQIYSVSQLCVLEHQASSSLDIPDIGKFRHGGGSRRPRHVVCYQAV